MKRGQAGSIRGTVMQAFGLLTSEQIRELVTAPFVELRTEVLIDHSEAEADK